MVRIRALAAISVLTVRWVSRVYQWRDCLWLAAVLCHQGAGTLNRVEMHTDQNASHRAVHGERNGFIKSLYPHLTSLSLKGRVRSPWVALSTFSSQAMRLGFSKWEAVQGQLWRQSEVSVGRHTQWGTRHSPQAALTLLMEHSRPLNPAHRMLLLQYCEWSQGLYDEWCPSPFLFLIWAALNRSPSRPGWAGTLDPPASASVRAESRPVPAGLALQMHSFKDTTSLAFLGRLGRVSLSQGHILPHGGRCWGPVQQEARGWVCSVLRSFLA